jgi:hypothetical protein
MRRKTMSVFFFTETYPFRQRLFHTPGQFLNPSHIKSRTKALLKTVTNEVSVCKLPLSLMIFFI